MPDINHKEIPVEGRIDPKLDRTLSLLDDFREHMLMLVAAAIYVRHGSLDHAADAMLMNAYYPPSEYQQDETDDDEGYYGKTEMRRWLDDNREHILETAESEAARKLARLVMPPIW